MFTFPKRLIALILFAALAAIPTCELRAQWVQCSGPEGGSILTLAAIGRYTFAGTIGGTLYRSSNAGATWSQVLGTTNTEIKGIAISGSTVFVASDSMYISNDSGLTWTARGYFVGYSRKAGALAVLGRYLLLASPNGVFRTLDQGLTWKSIGGDLSQCLMVKDGDIYVGSGGSPGLSSSTDSGETWTDIAIVDSINDRVQSLAFAGNNIFAGSYFRDKFYRSTDNGITWDTITIGLPQIGNEGSYEVITSLYQDSAILFAGTVFGLFSSLDTGASWTKVSSMNVQSFIRAGGYLLAGTATEGIVRSTDHGLHWTSSNTGLRAFQITAFASIGTHLFVGVNGKGIYLSDDSGGSFIPANKGIDSLNIDQIIAVGTMLFAFTPTNLFVSSNLGASWDTTPVGAFAPAAAIGSSLIAINNNRSFVLSSDGGATWSIRSAAGDIVSLVSNGSDLLACFGTSQCDHYVLSSSDSGLTWNLTFNGDCTCIYSVATDGDYLFAGTGPGFPDDDQGIFRKKKADTSWSYPSSFPDVPLGSFAINSITSSNSDVFISTDEGMVYLGQEGIGVFHSSDYGDNWSTFNEGLTALIVPQLFIFPPYIFAGTQSASVWRRPLSDFGISAVSPATPSKQEFKSYPNPFSQSTQISFTSVSAGYADISVENLLGEQVARIFSGELDVGEHNFTFSNNGLPEGMYECLVRMNGRVETLPMVLLH